MNNSGKFAESIASMERVVAEIEVALQDKEAEELAFPLRMMGYATTHLGDGNAVKAIMTRAMAVCEKHHGGDGIVTCQMRTQLGKSFLLLESSISVWAPSPLLFIFCISAPSPHPPPPGTFYYNYRVQATRSLLWTMIPPPFSSSNASWRRTSGGCQLTTRSASVRWVTRRTPSDA